MLTRSTATRTGDGVKNGSALHTMAVVAAIIAALYIGREFAIPIAIAILISFSLGPLMTALRRRHIPRVPAVILTVAPALIALAGFAYIVTTGIGHFVGNIPSYQANIETKLGSIEALLPAGRMLEQGSTFLQGQRDRALGIAPRNSRSLTAPSRSTANNSAPVPVEIRDPEPRPFDLVRTVLGPLVHPVIKSGLVLLFVIFFLLERENLRDRIIRLAGAQDLHRTTMAMDEAAYRVSRFLLLQTIVNILFGLIVGLGLYLAGMPNAALWGGIAMLLRFIPYLGVAAAAVLPLAVAFAVDPGWTMLFWTAALFLVLELLVGNVIEPWLYESSTGLSPVALVVSLIFWTWLWGTIGLLLATPLTVCIAVIGRYVPQLSFLDVLLGNQAALRPEESFYQRLLANDPDEATEQAEEFLKTGTLAAFYDEVAIPALELAERDRLRGVLDSDQRMLVVSGVRIVAENLAPDAADIPAGDPVLCVAGRSELDEAAAELLAQLHHMEGRAAAVMSNDAATRAMPVTDLAGATVLCLCYLDLEALPHARYLARRFRRKLGKDVRIVAAFWGMSRNSDEVERARAETHTDLVVTSLEEAMAATAAALHRVAGEISLAEPDLEELAAQVSEVFSEPPTAA